LVLILTDNLKRTLGTITPQAECLTTLRYQVVMRLTRIRLVYRSVNIINFLFEFDSQFFSFMFPSFITESYQSFVALLCSENLLRNFVLVIWPGCSLS
jgi:hypothetical protein